MNTGFRFRLRQTRAVARLQLRRVFFSRRSFWVYLLALFPAVIFLGHGIKIKIDYRWMSSQITSAALLDSISKGDGEQETIEKAGEPLRDRKFTGGPKNQSFRYLLYFDGERRWDLFFVDGVLQTRGNRLLLDFNEDRMVFATIFQVYYLRLAIFFGCLGIFMNLFRGEMMDRTLHFWLLTPMRREVLLAGKYLAGIITAVSIFTFGAVLCFAVMLWPHSAAHVTAYWQGNGLSHLISYASATVLACIGYGSVFLAFGMVLRNPIIPAVLMLFWENVNSILPTLLQKLSVLHYAQSLCPVAVPIDDNMPFLIRLLISPAAPPSTATAVVGFFILTALVLWIASHIVRRLEIDYTTE